MPIFIENNRAVLHLIFLIQISGSGRNVPYKGFLKKEEMSRAHVLNQLYGTFRP